MKNLILILITWFSVQGSTLGQGNEDPTGALFGCSFSGYSQCVLNAIKDGGDVNATLDQTPLMIVSGQGHIGLVQVFIDAGADVNASTRTGWTPLTYSVNEGHPNVIRLLIKHGADPDLLSDGYLARMHRLLEENPVTPTHQEP